MRVPEICRFYGIIIRVYYDDHNPPHFHAVYGDEEAWVNINTLAVFYGGLPLARIRLDDRMGIHASG